jgi:hypothetical protein
MALARMLHTAAAIAQCWNAAERSVRQRIAKQYWPALEEEITFLLRGELRLQLEKSTKSGAFAAAFERDLMGAVPGLMHSPQWRHGLAEQLIGSVSFHSRYHEGRFSGADLGLLVERPAIQLERGSHTDIRILNGKPQGLLVQSKLGRMTAAGGKVDWGTMSKSQGKRLAVHRDYYSLLLYRSKDLEGRVVAPFEWQLCFGSAPTRVLGWLRTGTFPNPVRSNQVIGDLARGVIGTDDPAIIDTVIGTEVSGSKLIRIRVGWPPEAIPPGGRVIRTHRHSPALVAVHNLNT